MSTTRAQFNLGASQQVSDISQYELLAGDLKVNRLFVDTVAYSAVGAGYGLAFSFFFRPRSFRKVMGFCIGFGAGQAIYNNCSPYINYWWNQRIQKL